MSPHHRSSTPSTGVEAAPGLDALADRRLRGLLSAHLSIVGDLDLPTVLRRIVMAACTLADAPYGALGVLDPRREGLEQFVHVGISHDDVERIGRLPEGRGLLGTLIEHPEPIRLPDLGSDPRSVGFPPGHPPMGAFLGVPVRIRDAVFGNLYLTRSTSAAFTAEEEEAVTALAATAAIAIENARLFDEARRRETWLEASARVTQRLLTSDGESSLQLVASSLRDLAEGDLATIVVAADEPEALRVELSIGPGSEDLVGLTFVREGSLSQRVIDSQTPMLADGARPRPPSCGAGSRSPWGRPWCCRWWAASRSRAPCSCCAARTRGPSPRPTWAWPPRSRTTPRWPSSSSRRGVTSTACSCSRTARGSPGTCTTT